MKKNYLQHINNPDDLKNLNVDQLKDLAQELREFIIDVVSVKKGHLGSSLGVIELTIALHYVFDTPRDLLVWDVGHQAYPHKILTGRRELFHTNRQLNGISGFPSRKESKYDAFGVGHASTSISAALGMAIASRLSGDDNKQHIAVIGDASIAGGMAFEGLNHAGVAKSNILIVLNDNEMGIDPNVGALKQYLTSVKSDQKMQKNIFEALNFSYNGPIDGHDLPTLIKTLKDLKQQKGPKFLHVITKKGKGLKQAEQNQVTYHAPGKFDKQTGDLLEFEDLSEPPKFQDVFGKTLVELAKKNEKIIGITAAMPTGTSIKYMLEEIPDRAFDVGIAEQHAVTMAAGLATEGYIPFCAIYSTFLQRAYDQIIHDIALQNLPVIFCLDRAGLVGDDGPTHHGVFDMAFLRLIPNMVISAPMNEIELRNIMFTAQEQLSHPIAIRYPRGKGFYKDWQKPFSIIEIGKGRMIRDGKDMAVLSIGTIGETVCTVLDDLKSNSIAHFDMRFVKPLDKKLLNYISGKFAKILIIEEGVLQGGFGSAILEYYQEQGLTQLKIKRLGIPDEFIEQGSVSELLALLGLDFKGIKKEIKDFLND
ncbi:1-deoxy-D-xylulose-5-phosphate synthase [Namhaeicola litoreus]|uniref:1-deoxy-D-xylulose-5-phosphate synthase n=1 Tax=Namhaeicola litoreus TaxID=1052145 RepID=A0ABW3Y1G5_9FLAO